MESTRRALLIGIDFCLAMGAQVLRKFSLMEQDLIPLLRGKSNIYVTRDVDVLVQNLSATYKSVALVHPLVQSGVPLQLDSPVSGTMQIILPG